jgi:hypothetical protein
VDLVELHTKHASQHSSELAEVAKQLLTTEAFSLQTPVALDRGQGVEAVAVGSLGGHLKASSALASPLMKEFLELREDRGADAAFEKLANNPEMGEEFCEVWDACQEELERGVVCSVDDLVAFVGASKEAYNSHSKHLLVVLQKGGRLTSYKVEAQSLLT